MVLCILATLDKSLMRKLFQESHSHTFANLGHAAVLFLQIGHLLLAGLL